MYFLVEILQLKRTQQGQTDDCVLHITFYSQVTEDYTENQAVLLLQLYIFMCLIIYLSEINGKGKRDIVIRKAKIYVKQDTK